MVERDDSGYILKIASHSPSHPWWRITDELAEGLNGYREKPGLISSVGVFTGRFGLGSLENPKTVGAGLADVGITNPPANARMATEGKGTVPGQRRRAQGHRPVPGARLYLLAGGSGVEHPLHGRDRGAQAGHDPGVGPGGTDGPGHADVDRGAGHEVVRLQLRGRQLLGRTRCCSPDPPSSACPWSGAARATRSSRRAFTTSAGRS